MSLVERIAVRVEELYTEVLNDQDLLRMLLRNDVSLARHIADKIRQEFRDADPTQSSSVFTNEIE